MFGIFDTSTSGLVAQRTRMDIAAGNIANAGVRGFKRRVPIFSVGPAPDELHKPGVHVAEIKLDPAPGHVRFDPGHPHANPDGYVEMSNVSVMDEMINAIEAARAYDANITMINATKTMADAALRIIA
jgi:flagellar basal-body rod protein FlgC